jgi:mono/diheme cytochrome c family protein
VNYPVWELELGGGLLIALVAITHVFVSHFAVGGGLFLIVTENRAARRGDGAMLAWLRRHTKFFALLTLVFGAVTGVGIWFTIGLVHPAATSALIHTFVFGWAIEWVFFFVEIAAAILYLVTWDRVDRRTHLAFGWIYFVAAFGSLFVINGILSFMLTPGDWLASRSFGDGFFNPTFWPSLVVRTLGAIAFAGLYVAVTAWREEPGLRARLVRWAALWTIPAIALGPLAAWFYFRSAGFDLLDAARLEITSAAHAWRLTIAASLLAAGVLLAVALLARRWPRLVSLPAGLLLLVLGFGSIGGAEFLRESIRKPFVIGGGDRGYLYAYGLTPAEVSEAREHGLLPRARWAATPESGDARGRGEDLFRLACRACHTVSGYRAIRTYVDGRPLAAVAGALPRLDRLRGRMPPFPGNADEQRDLALYLAGLDGAIEAAPAPGEGLVARGRAVLDERCLICHAGIPLRPRVAGWTEDRAYEVLGRLPDLNPAMPDFEGTDDERRALAAYLAALAAGNVE